MLLRVEDVQPERLRVPILPAGGPLLISDSPEYASEPGALYRDTVVGAGRILYHHVNATAQPMMGAIVVRNPAPMPLWMAPTAFGACAGNDYMGCGAAAVAAFLAPGVPKPARRLSPGELMVWQSRSLWPGELWTAILSTYLSGPAEVFSLMVPPGGVPDPRALPLLPAQDPQARGTQAAAERLVALRHRISAGPAGLQLANPPAGSPGTWAEPLPGEYLPSYDPNTGSVQVISGNYGVTYHISLVLVNDDDSPALVQIALNPRGGPYFGPLAVAGQIHLPPRPIAAQIEAWAPANILLPPGSERWLRIRFVPSGASFLPVRLLLLPIT